MRLSADLILCLPKTPSDWSSVASGPNGTMLYALSSRANPPQKIDRDVVEIQTDLNSFGTLT
jgi:hypothetical protein